MSRTRICAAGALYLAAGALSGCVLETRFDVERDVYHKAPHHERPRPALVSQDRKAAFVPSAGPLDRSMVGRYMDDQERALRAQLRGASVLRIGDEITIAMRDETLFEGDALAERGHRSLMKLSQILRRYDRSTVVVSGFSDTAGTPEHSLAFSRRCANAVAADLSLDGVDTARITVQGLGAQHPRIVTGLNTTEPRNRRIEIRTAPRPQS